MTALQDSHIEDRITASNWPQRIDTIVCSVSQGSVYRNHFPINLLRNVALLHVKSSHILLVDGDMRLSCTPRACLLCVAGLGSLLTPFQDDNAITIIPTLFLVSNHSGIPATKADLSQQSYKAAFTLSRPNDKSSVLLFVRDHT